MQLPYGSQSGCCYHPECLQFQTLLFQFLPRQHHFPLLERLWTLVTEKIFADVLRFLFLINVCFGEYLTAINGDLYGENVGALPGDFIILLCICHGDLNGAQPFMGSSVSYLLNGETITAFFSSVKTKIGLLFTHL